MKKYSLYELVGSPGSGKSYIVNQARFSCVNSEANYAYFRRGHGYKVLLLGCYLIMRWLRPVAVFIIIFLKSPEINRACYIKRVKKTLLLSSFQFFRKETRLLDQGVAQSLWSIVAHSGLKLEHIDKNLIFTLYGGRLPDCVFYVTADDFLIGSRLEYRKSKGGNATVLHMYSKQEIPEKIRNSRVICEHIVAIFKQLKVPVIELDGDSSVNANLKCIHKNIRQ